MTRNPQQRILTTMALSLVGAALAAGTADAGHDDRPGAGVGAPITKASRPDDRAGLLGVGAASSAAAPRTIELGSIPYLSHGIGVDQRRFDGQEQALGLAGDAVARSTTAATRPDDRGSARGPGVYFSAPPVPASSSTDDFQWGDASTGAGAMLAAMLLVAGLAVSIRHRSRAILP